MDFTASTHKRKWLFPADDLVHPLAQGTSLSNSKLPVYWLLDMTEFSSSQLSSRRLGGRNHMKSQWIRWNRLLNLALAINYFRLHFDTWHPLCNIRCGRRSLNALTQKTGSPSPTSRSAWFKSIIRSELKRFAEASCVCQTRSSMVM